MGFLHVAGIVVGALVVLVALFLGWRYIVFVRNSRRHHLARLEKLRPVTDPIQAGREPRAEDLERAAQDPETRNELYGVLLFFHRHHLFPEQYLTWEAIAESDMVCWLSHPHELAASPDEIELMERIKRPSPKGRGEVEYFVYRFRVHEPHWSAKDGWMAGVAGPYNTRAEPMPMGAEHTFSRFEAWESRTAEQHLDGVLGLVGRRRG